MPIPSPANQSPPKVLTSGGAARQAVDPQQVDYTMPNPLAKIGQLATTPLMPQSWVDSAQNAIAPTADSSPMGARIRGFGQGALTGLRNLSSPLNMAGIALAPFGGGAGGAVAEGAEGLGELAGPTMDLLGEGPWAATKQVMPSGSDVDALTGALKYGLAKVPSSVRNAVQGLTTSGAPAAGAVPNSVSDLMNPGSQDMLQRMYQEANPVFKAMKDAGAFSGNRTVGAGGSGMSSVMQGLRGAGGQ